MSFDYDPLWDEQGRLRRGCTVSEALAWLTEFGSHSAGESVYVNGVSYKVGALLYGPRRKKLRPFHFRLAAKISLRCVPSSSPHKICGFCGGPLSAVADKTISRVYDGYYRQLNFSV